MACCYDIVILFVFNKVQTLSPDYDLFFYPEKKVLASFFVISINFGHSDRTISFKKGLGQRTRAYMENKPEYDHG
jgi:hypothetical protein